MSVPYFKSDCLLTLQGNLTRRFGCKQTANLNYHVFSIPRLFRLYKMINSGSYVQINLLD